MARLINIGGVGVIAAVLGMLVFLVAQVVPLFRGATLEELAPIPLSPGAAALVVDEYGELPCAVMPDGELRFHGLDGSLVTSWRPDLPGRRVTAVRAYPRDGLVLMGLDDGSVAEVKVGHRSRFEASGTRVVEAAPSLGSLLPVAPGQPLVSVQHVRGPSGRVVLARHASPAGSRLVAVKVSERRALGGKVRSTPSDPVPVGSGLAGIVDEVLMANGERILALLGSGEVVVFADADDAYSEVQRFRPFQDPDASGLVPGDGAPRLAAAGLVLGDVTVLLGSDQGHEEAWSLYPQRQPDGSEARAFGRIHLNDALGGAANGFAPSPVNKCYIASSRGSLEIRHMTTGTVRWSGPPVESFLAGYLSKNHDQMGVLEASGKLRRWKVDDHHPDGGWRAFFAPIWYEGGTGPEHAWQSSSGNDEFEPKLSLIPLIYGTLKGTLYAMVFALPVALLAAVYVSQFLRPELKRVIKPTMEIMASLPSVVLGFLAGLWLAPLVDGHLVALLLSVLALPLAALVFGSGWSRLPLAVRRRIPPGWEFLALLPVLAVAVGLAWSAAPAVEAALFSVRDPGTGQVIADFREWWRLATGLSYDARNSVVVGFVMGFAVIPVIFTIAEDALSNVPPALSSGSLALGASPWQTVWRIVVPTAMAGIFSAVMIGFGRAVGETMIVVMATGNTPVMELNPFSGMRTLSANIAVELPEAPVGHTHYRALFLGACCLFLMTFVLNTAAEVLRQRLRERYKVV
jgi:phosphate transport system permease protein